MALSTTTARFRAPSLLVETAGHLRKMVVSSNVFTVGRAEDCDVVIPDFRVSRLHARLVFEDGQYFIVDAGSRHGIFVNGHRCERAALKNNDEITLGAPGLRMVFLEAEGGSGTSSANVLLSRIASDSDSSDLEKLRLFLEAARSLGSGLVVTDVLRNMLDYALRLTQAERGFVYLRGPDGAAVLNCGRDRHGSDIRADATVSHSVVQEAMTSAAEFIAGDASKQSALAARQSIVMHDLKTVIAIPLRSRRASTTEVDGVLYLDSHSVSRNLSGVSHDVLRALAAECAALLESARLVEAEQAARQYRQEMEIAASIQRSLISQTELQCDFARVRGRSLPCREVGGDFFDVHVSADAVTVMAADVSGKGISAALLAAVIHGMFYAQLASGAGLVETVTAVNSFLCSRVAGQKYATLMVAQLHRGGMLRVVNCGHVPALVLEDGTITRISDGDLPVGLIAQTGFHVVERQLSPGARMCILTDGISEAENSEGVEFGIPSVEHLLGEPDPLESVLAAVDTFCGDLEAQDDRTLVVLERTA